MADIEMYEASPEMAAYLNDVCDHIKAETQGNYSAAVALSISIVAQTFIKIGGDVYKSNEFSEAVKEGLITTLNAYRQFARTTHKEQGRLN